MNNYKNYIGISRDHSGSMGSIRTAAGRDYNANIAAIKEAAITNNQDTIVSVVKCGVGRQGAVVRESVNSNVLVLKPLDSYIADGGSTPLFDSVGELIDIMSAVPDANDPNVSFLLMIITDGQDNSSRRYNGTTLSRKIKELQATDRWTFVFRVPRGYKRQLVQYGIPDGNILEWDQTEQGVQAATQATTKAFDSYYANRSAGATSTNKFYADMSNVSVAEVKAALKDISSEITIWPVLPNEDGSDIRGFVEKRLGKNPMLKGAAFYELTKTEPKVQDYKIICVREKSSGMVYSGPAARDLLGLPHHGDIRLAPGNFANYAVYIQSTSVNRKLPFGSELLYWPGVGHAFKEGISARR